MALRVDHNLTGAERIYTQTGKIMIHGKEVENIDRFVSMAKKSIYKRKMVANDLIIKLRKKVYHV